MYSILIAKLQSIGFGSHIQHLDISTGLWTKQHLRSFFNAVCLGNIANYFVRSDRESNQRPNTNEHSNDYSIYPGALRQ